ncbi:MAG: response regulator [Thiotrichales bacterium]
MNAEQATVSTILLVEDDAKLAALVREYLQRNGFRVGVEGRGDRAGARVLAERPDLVILDIMLPGKDGFAVCREIRPAYDVPVLMLSARDEDYICKPVQPRLATAPTNRHPHSRIDVVSILRQ